METESMLFAIECALADDIDEGNTDQAVEVIFDGVVKTLQRDTRFPRLTRTDYDLLLADVTKEAREGSAAVPEIRHRERGGNHLRRCRRRISPKLASVAN